ncbi:unnamed protein product [Strongylus vulgaris]|uniref:Integrase zinc-binding domain-containing protein n=1 Tax=Strongylus vulgaris TaxID=40348 RepID=A0A3P7IHD3_STRVU|nr:unnamed protein product [Strongylus vulgaris]
MTAEDIRKADELVIKLHQNQKSELIASKTQRKLNIVKYKNGIWKCYGRLGESHISEDAKNPTVVTPDSGLARLIIREAHGKLHCGTALTKAEIRKSFGFQNYGSR